MHLTEFHRRDLGFEMLQFIQPDRLPPHVQLSMNISAIVSSRDKNKWVRYNMLSSPPNSLIPDHELVIEALKLSGGNLYEKTIGAGSDLIDLGLMAFSQYAREEKQNARIMVHSGLDLITGSYLYRRGQKYENTVETVRDQSMIYKNLHRKLQLTDKNHHWPPTLVSDFMGYFLGFTKTLKDMDEVGLFWDYFVDFFKSDFRAIFAGLHSILNSQNNPFLSETQKFFLKTKFFYSFGNVEDKPVNDFFLGFFEIIPQKQAA